MLVFETWSRSGLHVEADRNEEKSEARPATSAQRGQPLVSGRFPLSRNFVLARAVQDVQPLDANPAGALLDTRS